MRGRNNRRSSNPLTRVYESNGPDVKVRGTAHHIAEKYQQLARDAQSSGDPVAAENYFQHAEHYQRLIATLQGTAYTPQLGYGRDDEFDDEDGDDVSALDAPQPYARPEPPAYSQREPRDVREPREPRESREAREPRENRDTRDNRGEGRSGKEGRQGGYRRNRDEDGGEPREYRASTRQPREEAPEAPAYVPPPPAPRPSRSRATAQVEAPPRVEDDQDIGLPAFITGAPAVAKERAEPKVEAKAETRVEARAETRAELKAEREESVEAVATDESPDAGDAGRVTRRRRRFRTRAERAEEAGEGGAGDAPVPEQPALFGE
ncbi:DUF4167 domain-containing protein [Xanthobacter sp. V4C-4]|uniref:DUF4167 domain-containing protein n=1 Tax=Xanthobacter cornucopiae TaxID=3119924 RepID=UPI00372AD073